MTADKSGRRRTTTTLTISATMSLWLLLCIPAAWSQSTGGELAESLVELRSEVDRLASELENKKLEAAEAIRSMGRQKADLESQIARENLRLKQLSSTIERETQRLTERRVDENLMTPVVLKSVDSLEDYVKSSLPFHTSQRLEELATIRRQTENGALAPGKALARLWAFTEDEFRLTRESGLYRQPVIMDGGEVLADVARIGMVMMFVQTADGRVGMSRKDQQGWTFVSVTDPKSRDQIEGLFGAFKKQLRTGYFTIPNALPLVGAKSAEVAQ